MKVEFALYGSEEKLDMVWDVLQKSKARSVSDLLGLGITYHKFFKPGLTESPDAQSSLAKEIVLLEQINKGTSDDQFQLPEKLEAHRRAMRTENCLQELLDLRKGATVTSARLPTPKEIQKARDNLRQIFFADWFIHFGIVWLMVLTSDGTPLFYLAVTKVAIEGWRRRPILGEMEPLNSEFLTPLQELSRPVETLVNLCNEGDLLVLCSSDSLHYVPVHAATISKEIAH